MQIPRALSLELLILQELGGPRNVRFNKMWSLTTE